MNQRRRFDRTGDRVVIAIVALCLAAPLTAQDDRMVSVDGRPMRVRTLGLPDGVRARPIVVFESGAGTGLDAWIPILPDVAAFAGVVAYDRAGIGGSEADGQPPTPRYVARKLHALLDSIGVKPPYVLVGHSWGGVLIRMFAAMYPQDVAGLVYVDPTDPRSLEQNLAYLQASGYSAEGARDFLERHREQMSRFVRSRTGTYRAEMEVIEAAEQNYFAEIRELEALPSIPASVLVSNRLDPEVWRGRPCEPSVCHEQWMRQRLRALELLAPAGRDSTVTLTTKSGHAIQRDQPSLVVSAIRQVLAVRTVR